MHPAIKILGFICLGMALNKLAVTVLIEIFCVIALLVTYWQVGSWLQMLWRMRWLFLSMLLVYGLTTPGEYVKGMPTDWGVTYEGIRAGSLQIARLATMLGGIALLMASTPRCDLIAGFYQLLIPLKALKLKPERFAARLCLTLQYLEDVDFVHQKNKSEKSWVQLLDMNVSKNEGEKTQVIELQSPMFAYIDWLGLITVLVAVMIIWF
jgi:energy-coupling factor transport system permease protein